MPTAHVDTFARDNLPPREAWPNFLDAGLAYPEQINAATTLLRTTGDPAIITPAETLTYAQLTDRAARIAAVLREDGLVPGNRVLLRGANNAWMAAAHLGVWHAGGIVVATMPLLRARELVPILNKARITHALCDTRLAAELDHAAEHAPELRVRLHWGAGDLEARCEAADVNGPLGTPACATAADDIALIGFTSGTTGVPKGTMHTHRDLLAICDTYAARVLRPKPTDVFIGSPPLAFTFGLGGLLLFPLRVGAATVLLEAASPEHLLPAIAHHRATVCFTAPTAWRAMAALAHAHDLTALRRCVSAGEALPLPVFEAWHAATGLPLMDGIGATEMLHIFIASPPDQIRPGSTGRVVPGYEARIVDDDGNALPPDTAGHLAVRGPTGCRYLADSRQATYVQHGWNRTGDTFVQDADGYFWYRARSDDMIISAGYNIAGPEVEAALLTHPAVAECGVVAAPDPERGQVVRAYVVLRAPHAPCPDLVTALQTHAKNEIAPYKYPRSVIFVTALPRTGTGKLQRFELRARALQEPDPWP